MRAREKECFLLNQYLHTDRVNYLTLFHKHGTEECQRATQRWSTINSFKRSALQICSVKTCAKLSSRLARYQHHIIEQGFTEQTTTTALCCQWHHLSHWSMRLCGLYARYPDWENLCYYTWYLGTSFGILHSSDGASEYNLHLLSPSTPTRTMGEGVAENQRCSHQHRAHLQGPAGSSKAVQPRLNGSELCSIGHRWHVECRSRSAGSVVHVHSTVQERRARYETWPESCAISRAVLLRKVCWKSSAVTTDWRIPPKIPFPKRHLLVYSRKLHLSDA